MCVSETIIEPVDINEANELMPKLLEIGMLNGHQLQMFKNDYQHVSDQKKTCSGALGSERLWAVMCFGQ